MVSTFKESRNHRLGLKAFAEFHRFNPNSELILIGDGVEEDDLRKLVSDLNLKDSVLFTGYLQEFEFVNYLQGLDLVWILGLGNDWAARAAAQAKACHIKVMAVDDGALSSYADMKAVLDVNILARDTIDCLVKKNFRPMDESFMKRTLDLLDLYQQCK